jgi:proteasome lid subunit RPN8/RPN11
MSQTQREAPPDIRQLAQQNLPQAPFPGSKQAPFRVYMDKGVHSRIQQHSTEDVSVEICGVLVGKWARDADGPYVHVLECIRGDAAANKFAEVTFTHETWARINQQMDSRFAQMAIVGWYHSHPSFGIFLSDRDRFIQENFFSGPGQIAYVVDPLRKTEGMFQWCQGKSQMCPHFWVGDQIRVGTAAGEEPAPAKAATEAAASSSPGQAPQLSREQPAWLNLAMNAALYVIVFILGFFLAGRLTDIERLRIEQGTLARALVYFKIRSGLREDLGQVDADLTAATAAAKSLAQEHLKTLQEPKGTQDRWAEVLHTLDRSSKRLGQIGAMYALTPQEIALLLALTDNRSAAAGPDKPETKAEKTPGGKTEEKKK